MLYGDFISNKNLYIFLQTGVFIFYCGESYYIKFIQDRCYKQHLLNLMLDQGFLQVEFQLI